MCLLWEETALAGSFFGLVCIVTGGRKRGIGEGYRFLQSLSLFLCLDQGTDTSLAFKDKNFFFPMEPLEDSCHCVFLCLITKGTRQIEEVQLTVADTFSPSSCCYAHRRGLTPARLQREKLTFGWSVCITVVTGFILAFLHKYRNRNRRRIDKATDSCSLCYCCSTQIIVQTLPQFSQTV